MNHDPGGKRIFPMPDGMEGSAHMSECGQYRHSLSRRWGTGASAIVFVGLNPSTATADRNDPTIVREIAFARRDGFSVYTKVNLMDYRATNQKMLINPQLVVRSEINLRIILEFTESSEKVVAAWGALHKTLVPYATELQHELKSRGKNLYCLGMTKGGFPRHPLYVKSDEPFINYII